MLEVQGLARAIDLKIVDHQIVNMAAINPASYLGSGKIEQIAAAYPLPVDVTVIDARLSAIQQRNLERVLATKVIDRTGLILEIFGARARTREGRLQVELAHLTYQRSRLVRSWTHLERQRGGFGFLGGPGETQIEADRRVIAKRITSIKSHLERVRTRRALQRKKRQRNHVPVIALVGYTNAGKSTLFNLITGSHVDVEDMPFATLDPVLRRIDLPAGSPAILSDTVGFISDLPTELIAAFRATLEEVVEADLILHVHDIAASNHRAHAQDVVEVLATLGVDTGESGRVVDVWNKIDILTPDERQALYAQFAQSARAIPVSAKTGEGKGELLARIETGLTQNHALRYLRVAASRGADLHWLYETCHVLARRDDQDTGEVDLRVRVPPRVSRLFARKFASDLRKPSCAT